MMKSLIPRHPQLFSQLTRKIPPRLRLPCGILSGLILLGGGCRLIPYLIPIRASDLIQHQQAIEFIDRHGLPLGTLLTRNQDHTAVVPLSEISPYFIQAIIAAEDQRFYQHGALDLRALGRAILEAMQAGEIVSGASTITMQLARMLNPTPRTLPHKLEEVWNSWRLVAGMNHDEILAAYINRLPMGGNIYGVEAAARIYFGVPASALNLAQASLLAGIPNDPVNLIPSDHWDALKRRQQYVLDRMVADQYITPAQAEQARIETVTLQPRQQGIIAAPHFLFWLAEQLPSDTSFVRTTVDRSLQQFVEAQLQQILQELTTKNVNQGAALVINNHTGEVLAYVGSRNYFSGETGGRNDGVQALRQPGSTLKPFLYQLALEKNIIQPNSILEDIPTYYAIPGAQLYHPTNYQEETFFGNVRVRLALANSLNIPAVRLLEKVGVATFLNRLHQLGFFHLDQSPDYYGLGLTLGSGEVSLWELAQAYVTLAHQGTPAPLITTLPSIPLNPPLPDLSSSPETWKLITEILSDRHARVAAFGIDSVLNVPFPAAVKTGTSSHYRDTWTVGFTTDYTVATWVGNFSGERMQEVSGVTGAAPLWHQIMIHLHERKEPKPLPVPGSWVKQPICATTGLTPTPECQSVVLEYVEPQSVTTPEIVATRQPSDSEFKIQFPREDDYFLVDPTQPDQVLQFQVITRDSVPVNWWLNGKPLISEGTDQVFWSMVPGEWTLEVQQGDQTDRVQFQVQVGESPKFRRGFSVNSSN